MKSRSSAAGVPLAARSLVKFIDASRLHRYKSYSRSIRVGAIFLATASVWIVGASVGHARENESRIRAAISTISITELREHIGLLADDTLEGREAGSRGGRAAAKYLVEQFQSIGLQPAGEGSGYVQRFNYNMQNLLAAWPGNDPELAAEYLVVGAHYDHVGYGNRSNSNGPIGYIHNGADDNASGVAALLEVAEALVESGVQPRRTILFALWDGEEKNLLGSRHWVRNPTVPLESVKLAINMDMVGRLRNGTLQVGGTRTGVGLRQLFSSRSLPDALSLDFTWEFEGNSDHWSFYERQRPAVFIHTGLHDDYHRPSDDIERVNTAGMHAVAGYLVDVVCRLAEVDRLPDFRSAAGRDTPYAQRQREAPLPSPAPRLGAMWRYVQNEDPPEFRVQSIVRGSPAAAAGLQPGDRITSIDGIQLTSRAMLPAIIQRASEKVVLSVVRGDQPPTELAVQLAGSPSQLGLAWRRDPAEPGSVYVTRVLDFSPAALGGLSLHDRILGFDGEPVSGQSDLLTQIRQRLDEGAEQLTFEVETNGRIRTVQVDMRLPADRQDDPEF